MTSDTTGDTPFGPPETPAMAAQSPTTPPSPAPFTPVDAPPLEPPASAPHYAPPPAPPAPPAPPPPRARVGVLAGAVTQAELTDGRPPLDLARWLTVVALLIGALPLLLTRNATLMIAGAALAVLIAVVGGWLALAAGRQRRLLRLSMQTPTGEETRALLVDPTGQPDKGDSVEARGGRIGGGVFYATRLRVTQAAPAGTGAGAPARPEGMTYTGRARVSLLTPLLTLLFCVFFWVILYIAATMIAPRFLGG